MCRRVALRSSARPGTMPRNSQPADPALLSVSLPSPTHTRCQSFIAQPPNSQRRGPAAPPRSLRSARGATQRDGWRWLARWRGGRGLAPQGVGHGGVGTVGVAARRQEKEIKGRGRLFPSKHVLFRAAQQRSPTARRRAAFNYAVSLDSPSPAAMPTPPGARRGRRGRRVAAGQGWPGRRLRRGR